MVPNSPLALGFSVRSKRGVFEGLEAILSRVSSEDRMLGSRILVEACIWGVKRVARKAAFKALRFDLHSLSVRFSFSRIG